MSALRKVGGLGEGAEWELGFRGDGGESLGFNGESVSLHCSSDLGS